MNKGEEAIIKAGEMKENADDYQGVIDCEGKPTNVCWRLKEWKTVHSDTAC